MGAVGVTEGPAWGFQAGSGATTASAWAPSARPGNCALPCFLWTACFVITGSTGHLVWGWAAGTGRLGASEGWPIKGRTPLAMHALLQRVGASSDTFCRRRVSDAVIKLGEQQRGRSSHGERHL
jgi:hypothetical protein